MIVVEKAALPAWNPDILVSENLTRTDQFEKFVGEVSLGYVTPDIVFSSPEKLFVSGNGFTMKSDRHGDVPHSFYILPPELTFEDTVAPGEPRTFDSAGKATLVVGNIAHDNYYHWTLQCLAALLMYREQQLEFVTVLPTLNQWQWELLRIIDFEGQVVQLGVSDFVQLEHGVHSNLTGGDFSFAPHPKVIEAFVDISRRKAAARKFGRKIYASRLDAGNTRPLVNENDVCALMAAHGYEIITPGRLSVEEQIAAFRGADVIVGAHGAGLSNIVYCENGSGTRLVELFQNSCMNPCYAKLCHAKGMAYLAVVNPDAFFVDETGQVKPVRNVNDIGCEIDLKILEAIVSTL